MRGDSSLAPFMKARLCFASLAVLLCVSASGAEEGIVKAGAGSYTTTLPVGAKGPPAEIFRTAKVKGPMPTNDWWSSLAWVKFSDAMFPHPLAVRAMEGG